MLARVFFPKTRTINVSDTVLLLVAAVANFLINGSVLNFYLHRLMETDGFAALVPWNYLSLLRNLLSTHESAPWFFDSESTNFFYFISYLHFRTLIVGLSIFWIAKVVGVLEEWCQAIPYQDEIKPWQGKLLKQIGCPPDSNSADHKYEKNKINFSIRGFDILKWCRDAIYHPWAHLTKTNRMREILMVDVLTTEGSQYSGAFTSWVRSGESYSEIAMEYALRYYPKENPNQPRKKYLIKNNGELVLARERIETIHFWEIRKKTKLTVIVSAENDIEVAKWFLVLAYIFPKFIRELSIQVDTRNVDWSQFRVQLNGWATASRIAFSQDAIKIEVKRMGVATPAPTPAKSTTSH